MKAKYLYSIYEYYSYFNHFFHVFDIGGTIVARRCHWYWQMWERLGGEN